MRSSFYRFVLSRAVLSLMLLVALLPWPAPAQAASQAGQEIILHVETPTYYWDETGLHVPGYAALETPGAPALPVWTTTLELPAAGQWRLRYEADEPIKLALNGPLPAAPTPLVDLDGPVAWQNRADLPTDVLAVDRPDPAIYGQDAFYPAQPVQAGQEQWQRGRRMLLVRAFPFQVNPARAELLYYPSLRITITVEAGAGDALRGPAAAQLVTPAAPQAVDGALRIRTTQRGLHRLTYQDLQAAGVPLATLNPATLAMNYLNQPVDIQVTGAADGRFDPGDLVLFYAVPYSGRFMAHNVYQLTYGGDVTGQRMATRTVAPNASDPLVTTMTRTVRMERNLDYRSLYPLPPEADRWFDTALFVNANAPTATANYLFDQAPAIAPVAGTATVRVSLHGGTAHASNPDQSVAVRLNSHNVGVFQWDGSTAYLASADVPTTWLDQTPNRITLETALAQLPQLTFYWVSPDWVEITYPTLAQAYQDRLYIEAIPAVAGQRARVRAAGFSTGNVRIYDVRNPGRPVQLLTTQPSGSGSQWSIDFWDQWAASAAAPSYFVTTDGALLAPLAIERDLPSKLLSPNNSADYIAIVHASLASAVQPLLDRRTAEGLRIKKVDVQDIYDEVSGGMVHPEAIRTFLTYAYQQWNQGGAPPRYVLLVGDGHYDFKNHMGANLPNLIPPYLAYVDPFLGETAADNRYVSVDGPDDFLPDMHIGRIAAKTAADVTAYVNKVAAYEAAPAGAWQQRVIFVADNKDDTAGNFHTLSDDVRLNWLPEPYDDTAIYYRMNTSLDTGAKMRSAIKAAMNNGAGYLQWFGHASQFRWGSVSMFDILDPATLNSTAQMPFVAHYGCWSGYFIAIQGSPLYNRNEQSLGEVLTLTPNRGAIADLSPTGLHLGSALLNLNRGLVKAIYQDGVVRVGEAVDAGKLFFYQSGSPWVDLLDTTVLFGDPALQLRVPRLGQHFVYLPMLQAE